MAAKSSAKSPAKKTTARRTRPASGDAIRRRLKHKPFQVGERGRLDTDNVGLNAVFGDHKTGIKVGSLIELSGQPSSGKSAIAMDLAACAQQNDFVVGWVDFEQSFEQPPDADTSSWASRRGLECHSGSEVFELFQPYLGTIGREKEPRLITGGELLTEVEEWMAAVRRSGKRPFIVLDSVASILPDDVAETALPDQNMTHSMSLPKLMAKLTTRWIGRIASCSGIGVFINQLREKPGVLFGDPTYTPGGNSLPFYAHVRVRMRRKGSDSGKMRRGGEPIGIKGIMRNYKNKAGGVEGREIGYKIFFDGRSQFVKADRI